MSTFVILIYLAVVIAVLLGIVGLVTLIWGLINKDKKVTTKGTIITAIAAILIVSGAFCGVIKVKHNRESKRQMRMECFKEFNHGSMGAMCMDMDSLMEGNDSLVAGGDSCCEKMSIKCDHMKKMKCIKMKCSPSECKSKCDAEKK